VTLGATLRGQGFQANLDVNGRTLSLVSGGGPPITFTALVNEQPALDPRLNLGSDGREYVQIVALRYMVPVGLLAFDARRQQFLTDETGQEYKLVRRDDNPGNENTVTFWAVKVTGQDS
jgi:hypothetical protein